MSIFKRKRTIDGKVVKSNEYTVQFKDMSGVWRRVTAFVDKSASKQLDQGIQRLVDIRQVNGLLEATDNQFLEACPTMSCSNWSIGESLTNIASRPKRSLTSKSRIG